MEKHITETIKCLEEYKIHKDKLIYKKRLLITLQENRKEKKEREEVLSEKIEDISLKNIQMERELEEEIEILTYYIHKVELQLEEVRPAWKEILEAKYVENNTWRITANIVGRSEATCRRYAKEALNELSHRLLGVKSYTELPLFNAICLNKTIKSFKE